VFASAKGMLACIPADENKIPSDENKIPTEATTRQSEE
jgi:hypothetical protein